MPFRSKISGMTTEPEAQILRGLSISIKETPSLKAFGRFPETPACFNAPVISPLTTLRIEDEVTEKSPLDGFAVCAPITEWTTQPSSISSITESLEFEP